MFRYKVLGVDEAQNVIDYGWPTRIVTIMGAHDGEVVHRGEHHHIETTADVFSVLAYNAPDREMVERVLAFTKNLTDDDTLLVHCMAGISRSTAIMIGILIQHGMGPEDAFNAVRQVRPQMAPNTLIISLIDDIFELDGALKVVVKNSMNNLRIKGLSWSFWDYDT